MKALFRLLGSLLAVFLILITLTGLVGFIRKVWFGAGPDSRGHVAVLEVSGIITSSHDFLHDLDEQLKDHGTKALVVRINSPGGMVAPSQEIFQALQKADEKIPVIASMSSVGASGGYYISLGARRIYANPGTLTASIGVIMEFFNVEKLVQWARVERYSLTAGRLKDAGSPFRAMKPEEREFFTAMLADIHQQFRAAVQSRRKLTDDELSLVADGRVMTGKQAAEAKLVDELGGISDAIDYAKRIAKLDKNAPVEYPEKDVSPFRRFFFGKAESSLRSLFSTVSSGSIADTLVSPRWSVMLLAPIHG